MTRAIRPHRIDLLFNPKYSIPLRAPCPSVWVCHGLDWYVMPWASRFVDRLSHRFLVPRYAARANAIIAVSEVTRGHVLSTCRSPLTAFRWCIPEWMTSSVARSTSHGCAP